MVASANGRPLHRAGCNRAWIWILMGTADVKPSAAAELTPLLKERPSAAEAKAWCEDNLPRLPADQRAAILGLTPRGALQYDADPVPAALSESTGATATMVAQREATRFTITGSNATKAKMLESFNAELSNSLFTSIELAAKTNAPLLVKKLKRDHPQGGGFAGYYDGVAAWKALVAMGEPTAQQPGESSVYELRLAALNVKKLPADADSDAYAKRINEALTDIIPYTHRKFASDEDLGLWTLSQCPSDYVAQARANYASLTADQKKDPHRVASLVVDTIATARDDLGLDLKKAWDEYVGLGDEGTPPLIGPGGGGRRPGGLRGGGRGRYQSQHNIVDHDHVSAACVLARGARGA